MILRKVSKQVGIIQIQLYHAILQFQFLGLSDYGLFYQHLK